MTAFDDITIIVPVREGSSRIENKIFLPLDGEITILEWKIAQLLKVQKPERILVSSNSENVRKLADRMGVGYHQREDYLSVGHAATFSEVITGIVKDIPTNHFAWVTVVVPLMSPEEYTAGLKKYIEEVVESGRHDSLVAVNLLKEYFWNDNGPLNYQADRNHTISQHLPNIFRVTNGLYMSSKEHTLNLGYFLGPNPYKFQVSKLGGIDIDEQEDYEFSRMLLPYYKNLHGNPF